MNNILKLIIILQLSYSFAFAKGEVSKIFAHYENPSKTKYDVKGKHYKWGEGKNIVIDAFEYNGHRYDYVSDAPIVKIRRVDNNNASGEPCDLFAERINRKKYHMATSFPNTNGNCDMAKVMSGRIINVGALDVFKNVGYTAKNVERVDFISPQGITAPSNAGYLSKAGHVVTEKSGNNYLQIAAILSIDSNNNPTSFGPLVMVHKHNDSSSKVRYGLTNIYFPDNSHIYRQKLGFYIDNRDNNQGEPWWIHNSNEPLGMAFITLKDLDINAGQKYYGFAYFGRDVNTANDVLTDISTYPRNTGGDTADPYGGVASYFVDEEILYDFGDAPTNFPHVSHKISNNLYLGNHTPDNETDQQSSADASADGADDSDGVVAFPSLTIGDNSFTVPVKVFNNTGKNAYISAWVDFNRDGIFQFNEALNSRSLAVKSSNSLQTINVSWDNFTDSSTFGINNAKVGKTIVRFRLSTSRVLRCAAEHYANGSDLNYGGNYFISPDGEVEDYEITVKPSKPTEIQNECQLSFPGALNSTSGQINMGASSTVVNGNKPLTTKELILGANVTCDSTTCTKSNSLVPLYNFTVERKESYGAFTQLGNRHTISESSDFNGYTIYGAGVLTLQGDITLNIENSFTLSSNTELIIDGDVTIYANQLSLGSLSRINIKSGASLKLIANYIDFSSSVTSANKNDSAKLIILSKNTISFGSNIDISALIYSNSVFTIGSSTNILGALTASQINFGASASINYSQNMVNDFCIGVPDDDKENIITPEDCSNAPQDIVDFSEDFEFNKNTSVSGNGEVGTVATYANVANINGVDIDLKVKILSLTGLSTLALPSNNTNTVPKGFKLQKIGDENSVGFFIDQIREDSQGTEYSTELEFSYVAHGTNNLVSFDFETQVYDLDNFANRTEYLRIKENDYKFFQTDDPTHIVGTQEGEWSTFTNSETEDSQGFNKNSTVKFVHENKNKFTMKFTHVKNKSSGQYGGKAGFNVVFGKPNNGLPTCASEPTEGVCYAIDDVDGYIYSLYMNPGANPLPIGTKIISTDASNLDGEAEAFRSKDGLIYAFDEDADRQDRPFLYSVNPENGDVNLVSNFYGQNITIRENVIASSFYNGYLYLIAQIESEGVSYLYKINPEDNWKILFEKKITGATQLTGLAINTNGQAYSITDHGGRDIYSLDLNTAVAVNLNIRPPKVNGKRIEAEGLSFAKDGNLYVEDADEDALDDNIIYKIDLSNGTLIPAATLPASDNVDIEGLSCNIVSRNIPPTTLLADYHFDECMWNGTAGEVIDSSGTYGNGTAKSDASTELSPIINRNGLFSKSAVVVPNNPSVDMTKDITLSAWVYVNDLNEAGHKILFHKSSGSEFDLTILNKQIRFFFDGRVYFDSNSAILTESKRWYHIAVTRNLHTKKVKFYIDGKKVSTKTFTDTEISTSNADLSFGTKPDGVTNPLNGKMDEVKIYNGELSSSEITEIYNNELIGKNADSTSRDVIICSQYDFGDAPSSYEQNNPAKHILSDNITLGNIVDAENNALSSADARGDNNSGQNDEEGMAFHSEIVPGKKWTFAKAGNGHLDFSNGRVDHYFNAWIDLNRDGDWDDANEHIVVDKKHTFLFSPSLLRVDIPSNASSGTSYARFRVCATQNECNTPYGLANSGEVEDYQVTIQEASSINGTVWKDENKDNIKDADESKIANIIVLLYDNAGNILEESLTDNNGLYSFIVKPSTYKIRVINPSETAYTVPVKNEDHKVAEDGFSDSLTVVYGTTTTVDAGLVPLANTISYCEQSSSLLSSTTSISIPKFDASVGTLNAVNFSGSCTVNSELFFENTSAGTANLTYTTGADFSIVAPDGSTLENCSFEYNMTKTSGLADHLADYAGTAGLHWAKNKFKVNNVNYENIDDFVGTDNISMNVNSSDSHVRLRTTGGNGSSRTITEVKSNTCVTYSYDIEPIAEYRFDACMWNGTAGEVIDSSGNNLHGTAINSANTDMEHIINRSGKFEKTSKQYVEFSGFDDVFGTTSSAFTFTTWINPSSLSNDSTNHDTKNTFMAKASDHNNDNIEIGVNPNGTLHIYLDTNKKDTYVNFGKLGDIKINQWHFVAVTYDNGKVTVVIDDKTYTNTTTWAGSTIIDQAVGSPFTLAATLHGKKNIDNHFDGFMDEVKIFDIALSTNELNTIYTNELSGKNHDGADRTAIVCAEPTLLTIEDAEVIEGDTNTTMLNFIVKLDKEAGTGVSFKYQIFDGNSTVKVENATSPSDYEHDNFKNKVVMEGNINTWTISVPVNGDKTVEDDEKFTIVLSEIHGATFGNSSAVGTIINDDSGISWGQPTDLDEDNDGILDEIEFGDYPNLVQNPSFESDNCSDANYFQDAFTSVNGTFLGDDYNNNQLTGWNYTSNIDCWVEGTLFALTPYGTQYIDLQGNIMVRGHDNHPYTRVEQNHLTQTITTIPGKTYRFSFWWGEDVGHIAGEPIVFTMKVIDSINNTMLSNETLRETAEGRNTSIYAGPNTWYNYEAFFVATSTQTKLDFSATPPAGNLSAGADIDMVSVKEVADHDNDGVPDFLDLDSDNDGIPDNIEAQTTQGYVVPNNEFDGRGVDTAYPNGLSPIDTDDDNRSDYLDLDSDNDGIFDIEESGLGNNDNDNDGRTNNNVGINGLDNDTRYEAEDSIKDVNAKAHDGLLFALADSDNDTQENGSNAAPMGRDFDYRDNSYSVPKIYISDEQIIEGNSSTTNLEFTVSLDKVATLNGVTFNYQIFDGDKSDKERNAIAPSDYDSHNEVHTVTLDGATQLHTILVPIVGDTRFEKDEVFTIVLSNIQGADSGTIVAVGTIINDDLPSNSVAEYRFDECMWNGDKNEVKNSSSDSYHGVSRGAQTITDGAVQRAAKFTRTKKHYVEFNGFDEIFGKKSEAFTVTAWLNPKTLTNSQTNHKTKNTFFAKASDSKNDNIELGINPNGTVHVYLDTKKWDTYADFGNENDIKLNSWNFVAVKYSHGTVTVQINDKVYINSTKWKGATLIDKAIGSPVTIGASLHIYNYFDGAIDEVKIFDIELMDSRLKLIYTNELNKKNSDGSERTIMECAATAKIVADYHFDECIWDGTEGGVKDSSLNHFNGTAKQYAKTVNDGKLNRAGKFDGKGAFVSIANQKELNPDTFTVSTWVLPESLSSRGSIITKSSNGARNDGWGIGIDTDTKKINFYVNHWNLAHVSAILPDGWSHVVASYDGKMLKIYINGKLEDTLAYSEPLKHSDAEISIGKNHGNSYSWKGMIDEVKLFDGTLSTFSVKEIYDNELISKNWDGTKREAISCMQLTSLSINSPSVKEGDDNNNSLDFTVSLAQSLHYNVFFSYSVSDGSATLKDKDYVDVSAVAVIEAGQTATHILVPIIGDVKKEGDESVYMNLYNGINVLLPETSQGKGIIEDDDSLRFTVERINSNSIDNENQAKKESLYTQITGKDFDYSIVVYDKNNDLYEIDNITVKVELYDYNTTKKDNLLYTYYKKIANKGSRFDVTIPDDLALPIATRDAHFRVNYIVDSNNSIVTVNQDYEVIKEIDGNKEIANDAIDDFAIRPATYKVSIQDSSEHNSSLYSTNKQSSSVNLAAGYDYTIQSTAMGYDANASVIEEYFTENQDELNVTLFYKGKLSCADTNDSKLTEESKFDYRFKNGKLQGAKLTHDNVGKYEFHVEDINWTSLDKKSDNLGCVIGSHSNIADNSGKFGCNIASNESSMLHDIKIDFKPYAFAVDNIQFSNANNDGRDYLYMNNLSLSDKMAVLIKSTVRAVDKSGKQLSNFTDSCEAEKIDLFLNFTPTFKSNYKDVNGSIEIRTDKGSLVRPQQIVKHNDQDGIVSYFENVTLHPSDFIDKNEGNSTVEACYNMEKNLNEPTNPITVKFIEYDVNASNIKVMKEGEEQSLKKKLSSGIINKSRTFYYARIRSDRANYPETAKKLIPIPLTVEIYCKAPKDRAWCDDTMNLTINGLNGNMTDSGWYIDKNHNSALDGNISALNSENADFESSPVIVPAFKNGRIDNVTIRYAGTIPDVSVKTRVDIITDPWLRYSRYNIPGLDDGTPNFFVTVKDISDTTGIGDDKYMSESTKRVESNGKMDW